MPQSDKIRRDEDLVIINGSLSDVELMVKIQEPISVMVATPWGVEHYKMRHHGALLVLEYSNTTEDYPKLKGDTIPISEKKKWKIEIVDPVEQDEPTRETEPVVVEQPENPEPKVEIAEGGGPVVSKKKPGRPKKK